MTTLTEDTLRTDPVREGVRTKQIRGSLTFYKGSLVAARQGSNLAETITARTDLRILGVATCGAVSTSSVDSNSGAIDADSNPICINYEAGHRGEFATGTGANAITADMIGQVCYAFDDNTLYATSLDDTLSPAGIIHSVDPDSALVTLKIEEDTLVPFIFGDVRTEPAVARAFGRVARGVVYNNQADLTAFTVASDEGLTYVEGNIVLLAGQTTAAQRGPYVVGAVANGTAPLTRPGWWAASAAIQNGTVIEVSEGTWFAGSSWKAMCTGACVVGTDDPKFYPRQFKGTFTLANGTYTVGFGSTATPDEPLFLFSTSKSAVELTSNTHAGTIGTSRLEAPSGSRVAGVGPATAVIVVNSLIDAGTVAPSDSSTFDICVTNW